ncbi:hypothetical protein ACHAPJ_009039 [Fusarium lateritium]
MVQKAHTFVTDGQSALSNGIHGLLSLHPSLRLDEKYKVLYRDAPDRDARSTIISGGGSGHEPAHAGLVGTGMLDAAVCGAIFASPNAAQVESALRTIQSPKGTLIIVKNYTGDKLNFTLAAERFRLASGLPIRLIVVADDVSIGRSRSGLVGRRALAGTALIHKISGGASAAGLDLDGIVTIAEFAMANMGTTGVGLDGCRVPGQSIESRLGQDELEIGMGIHNEPGSRRIKPRPDIVGLVKDMLNSLLGDDPERNYISSPPRPGEHDVVLLVNNLGGLSALEILAITNHVITQLGAVYAVKPTRVYSGTLLSSLDCPGFSITLLSLPKDNVFSPQILNFLDSPTDAFGWPSHISSSNWTGNSAVTDRPAKEVLTKTEPAREVPQIPCDKALFEAIVTSIFESLIAAEPEITRNDTILGDGDCGITLVEGSTSLKNALRDKQIRTTSLSHGMLKIADLISESMGGTSGALYGVLMTAFASGVSSTLGEDGITLKSISAALVHALDALGKVTAAREGDRTMMDALIPFVRVLSDAANTEDGNDLSVLGRAISAAKKGCEATAMLQSKFGRSTYVGAEDEKDSATEIPDPGAMGVVAIVSGIYSALEKHSAGSS